MHMKWLVLSLLIVFATACDTTHCTDQGCSSGFQLSFNAENDSLSQGDYTISIRTEDNEQMACLVYSGRDGSYLFHYGMRPKPVL